MIKVDYNLNAVEIEKDLEFTAGKIHIVVRGKNNIVKVGKNCRLVNCNIELKGDNIKFILGNNVFLFGTTIRIFQNCEVIIGENTSINTGEITAAEGKGVYIGKDCMIANGFEIRNSDMHPIYDIGSGERVNYGKSIVISNHVWLAKDVSILKGVNIADNVVVGVRSVVTKDIDTSNSIAIGAPAKVIRTGVVWGRMMYNKTMYDDSTISQFYSV